MSRRPIRRPAKTVPPDGANSPQPPSGESPSDTPKARAPLRGQYFPDGAAFRTWLESNQTTARELFVRCHKKAHATLGIVYEDALNQALCFGWIDGVVRRIDETATCVRFTPRRPGSIWSNANVDRVERLIQAGLMTVTGMAAFQARRLDRTGIYSFESKPLALAPDLQARFRSDAAAWARFQKFAPGYQRTVIFWVMTAKQPSTRERRFVKLIECSRQGELVPMFRRPPRTGA